MDPITMLMLAQGGASVLGGIYNIFATGANTEEAKLRQQQRYQLQKQQLALAKQQRFFNKSHGQHESHCWQRLCLASR